MKRLIAPFLMLALVSGCSEQPEGEPVVRAALGGEQMPGTSAPDGEAAMDASLAEADETPANSACRTVTFEEVPFTHCVADPALHRIKTALQPASGAPYASLGAFAKSVDPDSVVFAMNAGMFDDKRQPLGYFVQDEKRLSLLDRSDGNGGASGNFYLKPNGVFFGSDGKWRILGTEEFYRSIGERPQFGTQSGPLLLTGGKRHPAIAENGSSQKARNGVGIDKEGKAHFVISEDIVSFGRFTRFFSEELGIDNALYLDGGAASGLWDPAADRLDEAQIGPILVVTHKTAQP